MTDWSCVFFKCHFKKVLLRWMGSSYYKNLFCELCDFNYIAKKEFYSKNVFFFVIPPKILENTFKLTAGTFFGSCINVNSGSKSILSEENILLQYLQFTVYNFYF